MTTKLEPADIEAAIAFEDYKRGPGTVTICYLTLRNGFVVVGKSACIDPANFNAQMGQQIARREAVEQIWQLEGYRVMSERHAEQLRQGGG